MKQANIGVPSISLENGRWRMPRRTEALAFALTVVVAAICWTALRFEFTRQFAAANYARIYEFTAALPFGKRVLAACLARVGTRIGLGIMPSFQIVEILASIALVYGLVAVFRLFMGVKTARFWAIGIFAVMAFVFLAPSFWSLLFPWDIPAMAFTAWGTYWVLTEKWKPLAILTVFASFNRESALLLPMLWCAVFVAIRPLWKTLAVVILFAIIHEGAQLLVATTLADNVEFYNLRFGMSLTIELESGETWRLLNNWAWMSEYWKRPFIWLGTLAGLPVAFLWALKGLPGYLRRIGLAAWIYGGMLAVVGNVYEARVYGEISVLLYVPVALKIWECVSGEEVMRRYRPEGNANALAKWMGWLEGVVAVGVAVGVVGLGWAFAHGWGGIGP